MLMRGIKSNLLVKSVFRKEFVEGRTLQMDILQVDSIK